MLDKIKAALSKAFEGASHWFRRCAGADELGLWTLGAGVALIVLGRLTRAGWLTVPAAALYLLAIYRMLSHDVTRRREENRRFKQFTGRCGVAVSQWFNRVKNTRKYKYFRCPQCGARLRMPRGLGEKTVTCSRCGHSFRMKA